MPELPEVETMVRGIRDAMTGRTLRELRRCPCECRPLTLSPAFDEMALRANGQTVTAVRRVAKRVVIDLSNRDSFVIEPRMTGLMLIADPPDREHLRLEWQWPAAADHDRRLRFGFGIAVVWESSGCAIPMNWLAGWEAMRSAKTRCC